MDVPYVPLYLGDASIALSKAFTLPGYNAYSIDGAYALNLKASA